MAKVEEPLFMLPKKRNGKKANNNAGHVDHIITVQGAADEIQVKYKNGLSPVTEHDSGIIQSVESLKSCMKINLPIINDEDLVENLDDSEKIHIMTKNGYQAMSNNGREVVDLSPIYENSSDACSSQGDFRETDDLQKSCKILNETNEYMTATLNSLSQTQSESSLEMGNLTDSLQSAKRKKRVNIVTESQDTDNTDSEITALKMGSESGSLTGDCSLTDFKDSSCLTMTGTIKRGKKKGQQIDVKLNISREELEIIEAAIVAEEYEKMNISKCSARNGPHIFLFTLICLPLVACVSAAYSAYMCTLAWHNIISHLTENLTYKSLWLPILIMLYPVLVVVLNVGIGLYAGIIQLTFSSVNWWMGVCDFEKGFYGWLCNAIGFSECSPYEVVILMDVKS